MTKEHHVHVQLFVQLHIHIHVALTSQYMHTCSFDIDCEDIYLRIKDDNVHGVTLTLMLFHDYNNQLCSRLLLSLSLWLPSKMANFRSQCDITCDISLLKYMGPEDDLLKHLVKVISKSCVHSADTTYIWELFLPYLPYV